MVEPARVRRLLGVLAAVVVLASGCGTAAGTDGAAAAAANSTASPAAVTDPVGPPCTCGGTPGAATLAAGHVGDLDVGSAYVQASKGSAGDSAVAYLSIVNGGSGPARLVGASSRRAAAIDLTDATNATVSFVPLPAQATTTLAPDGYQLTVRGLAGPLRIGDSLPVTLRFSGGRVLHLDLPVAPR